MTALKKLRPFFFASALILGGEATAQASDGFDELLAKAKHDNACLAADLNMLNQAIDKSNVPAVPPIVGRVEKLVHHLDKVTVAIKGTFKYQVGSVFYSSKEKEKRAELTSRLGRIEGKMRAHPDDYAQPIDRIHALRVHVAQGR